MSKTTTYDIRALLPDAGHASVSVDAELFLDLIDAAGWVYTFFQEIDLSTVFDADAMSYLASEARIIREKALLLIDGWTPETLEVHP